MNIESIEQTCPACPSQWEGFLDDGRMFYARYRWGWLSIDVSKEPTEELRDVFNNGEEVYGMLIGDQYDGTMSTEELIDRMVGCGFTFS